MAAADTGVALLQRWVLVLAVVGSALIVGPAGGIDGTSAGKTAVVATLAVVALAAASWAAIRDRALVLPLHPAIVLAVGFALLLVLRALLSDRVALAFFGPLGRNNGVVLYLACVTLFVVAAARSRFDVWRLVGLGLLVTAVLVALLGIDEATFRLGPPWTERPGVAATLGNANFYGAWLGCLVPIAVVAAADRGLHRGWRVAGVLGCGLLPLGAAFSESFQAGYVMVAALAVLALVWSADRLAPRLWAALCAAVAGLGVLGAVVTVLGVAGRGPLGFFEQQVGVRLRQTYWAAATELVAQRPLLGIDPATFADHYRRVRTPAAAHEVHLASNTDSAHSVPLHLAAEAGLVVALVYVAVLVAVAWTLVAGLRAHDGIQRLWLGALGAAWVGYALQALISIDATPLATLGWVLGGLVVGGAAGPGRRWGAPPPRKKGRRRPALSVTQLVAGVLVGVLALAAVWVAATPYRADLASADGEVEQRRLPDEHTATSEAIRIAPWQAAHRLQLAQRMAAQGQFEPAERLLLDAMEVNPHSFEVMLNAARVAEAMDDPELARQRYERARELEPHHPEMAIEVAEFARATGDLAWARDLMEEVLAVDPDHDGARELLEEL